MIKAFFKWLHCLQADKGADNRYIRISGKEMDDAVKERIAKLEKSGEKYGAEFQKKYAAAFKKQGKHKLRIWVSRDIDGSEEDGLTGSECLTIEYRSRLIIDYEGPKHDEDFFAGVIYLWHRSGSSKEANGNLFNFKEYDLKEEIEKKLNELLIYH